MPQLVSRAERRTSPLKVALTLLALHGTTGCSASYTWGKPREVSSRTLSVATRPELANRVTLDKATLDGTTLRVQATHACTTMRDTVTETILDREEERTFGPDSEEISKGHRLVKKSGPGWLLASGIVLGWPIGGSLLGLGLNGALLGSSCGADVNRNFPFCGDEAWAAAITGAVITAGFAIAVPSYYASAFATAPPERVARSTTTSTPLGDCTPTAAEGVALFAALGDHVVELGKTDARGKLEAKLDRVVDAKALLAGRARWTLKLAVGGATEEPTEVTTDAFFAAMDDAVWTAADAPRCAAAKAREACADVTRYTALYPAGKHAREAASLVEAVVPVLEGGKP